MSERLAPEPLSMRVAWHEVRPQEADPLAGIRECAGKIFASSRSYPCALLLAAVDAYRVTAHPLFKPQYAFGQLLGRLMGMAVILDPRGVDGEVELTVCSGCRARPYPSCDYVGTVLV